MAAKSTIAKRYARAFASAFTDNALALKQLEEFEVLVATFTSDSNLNVFLKSPAFKEEEKWGVVSDILTKTNASKDLAQFMKVLVETGRILLIEEILSEFKKVMLDRLGEAEALVESACSLTDSELSLVKANLEKTIGKKLRVKVEVKPELVAGLRVRVDGKTLDGTLSSHLERLQTQLVRAEA